MNLSKVTGSFVISAPGLAFFLFGSLRRRRAKRFSDFDIGLTGGGEPLNASVFLRIQECVLRACEDSPVKVEIVDFDQALSGFILDFEGPLRFISGGRESFDYLKGKIDGLKAGQKMRGAAL